MFKTSQSLLDYLTRLMPDLKDFRIITVNRPTTNNKAAKSLFSLWKNEENATGSTTIKKPETMTSDEVDFLEREGLITSSDDSLIVTDKGQEVIKTMILGDDKSSYEDTGEILDLTVATANTKTRRTKTAKTASTHMQGNWYQRLK